MEQDSGALVAGLERRETVTDLLPDRVFGAVVYGHPKKACEDTFFVRAGPHAESGAAVGVFDGVGGSRIKGAPLSVAQFVAALARNVAAALPLPCWDAEQLRDALRAGAAATELPGASTACIVALAPDCRSASALNLGDSGFVVLRGGTASAARVVLTSSTQQHHFNCPEQVTGGEAEAGACARIADAFNFDVEPGDVIVVGSDGLWDNVFLHDASAAVSRAFTAAAATAAAAAAAADKAARARRRREGRRRQQLRRSEPAQAAPPAAVAATAAVVAGKMDDEGPESPSARGTPSVLGSLDSPGSLSSSSLDSTSNGCSADDKASGGSGASGDEARNGGGAGGGSSNGNAAGSLPRLPPEWPAARDVATALADMARKNSADPQFVGPWGVADRAVRRYDDPTAAGTKLLQPLGSGKVDDITCAVLIVPPWAPASNGSSSGNRSGNGNAAALGALELGSPAPASPAAGARGGGGAPPRAPERRRPGIVTWDRLRRVTCVDSGDCGSGSGGGCSGGDGCSGDGAAADADDDNEPPTPVSRGCGGSGGALAGPWADADGGYDGGGRPMDSDGGSGGGWGAAPAADDCGGWGAPDDRAVSHAAPEGDAWTCCGGGWGGGGGGAADGGGDQAMAEQDDEATGSGSDDSDEVRRLRARVASLEARLAAAEAEAAAARAAAAAAAR